MTEDGNPIRVGVSTCLLGEEVRHDGGHKRDRFVLGDLGRYVHFVPVCPEVAIGLGIPREPIHLARTGDTIRLVGIKSGADHTETMRAWADGTVARLKEKDLCGWVLKSKSPSCGLFRIKVYNEKGHPSRDGRGLFAQALTDAMPGLPVEEEGRLNDPGLRENFVERLFAYHRLQTFFASAWTVGDLVAFHSAEKLLLMAHAPDAYKTLGRMVAEAKGRDREKLERDYRATFMAAMGKKATPGRQTNVLQHMAGYVTRELDADDRVELAGVIEDYRKGLVPLIVPVTLIRHFVRRFGIDYLAGQTYLEPHPKEMMLRNHV